LFDYISSYFKLEQNVNYNIYDLDVLNLFIVYDEHTTHILNVVQKDG